MAVIDKIQGKGPKELEDGLVSFDKKAGKWLVEAEGGEVYEWEEKAEKWQVREEVKEEIKRQRKEEIARINEEKKRHRDEQKKRNSSVYVTGLPSDVTVDEIKETFSRCGVIAESVRTGEPQITIYKDKEDKVKGDCVVRYFRPESCALAIEMLDGTKLRADSEAMKVSLAVFEEKGEAKKRVREEVDAREVKKRVKKMKKRLEDWSDEEREEVRSVILKHCFTLEELAADPEAVGDITEDMKEGCGEVGEVEEVVVYDLEAEGVVSVRFREAKSVPKCIKRMDGRYFGGQKLQVGKWDGQRYKKKV